MRTGSNARRILVVVTIVAGTALAACGGGGSSSKAAPIKDCPLTTQAAQALIGPQAAPSPPGPIPGLPVPVSRCQYESSGKSVQLTVFPGSDVMGRLQSLISTATTVPSLSKDARCGGGTGGPTASFSCLFTSNGRTYVLALQVPAKTDTEDVRTNLVDTAKKINAATT